MTQERPLPTPDELERTLLESPYHRWLGLKVVEVHPDRVELTATPREEFVGDPRARVVHGGVLASLLDLAADWALLGTIGTGVPTVDLTVNYLRAAPLGTLHVTGRLVRPGRQVSVAESEVRDEAGRVVAVARGSFLSAVATGTNET